MTSTERWVRRLYHFNITQLALNAILLFLLGTWYVGLPTEADANRDLLEEDLPIANLPEGAFDSLTTPKPKRAAAAPVVEADPAMAALVAPDPSGQGEGGRGGEVEGEEAMEADPAGAAPGSGGQGPAPNSTGPINAYLEQSTQALRRAGSGKGVDVSPYLPTAEQWAGAVGTGDFFNDKTLLVLQRLKEGFKATGATMPALPGEQEPNAPFDPNY